MRFSKEMDQALRCISYLDKTGGSLSARAIAMDQMIPYAKAGKLLQKLAASGIISAQQGRQGGYRLSLPLEDINLLKLQTVLGDSPKLVPCLNSKDCGLDKTCPIRSGLGRFQDDLNRFLGQYSVADLIGEGKSD